MNLHHSYRVIVRKEATPHAAGVRTWNRGIPSNCSAAIRFSLYRVRTMWFGLRQVTCDFLLASRLQQSDRTSAIAEESGVIQGRFYAFNDQEQCTFTRNCRRCSHCRRCLPDDGRCSHVRPWLGQRPKRYTRCGPHPYGFADTMYNRRSDKTMSDPEPERYAHANAEPDDGAVISLIDFSK